MLLEPGVRLHYVSRWLALFGLIASAWCVICAVIFYIYPKYGGIVSPWWFDLPMAIFDIILSFWLLIRGLSPNPVAETEGECAVTRSIRPRSRSRRIKTVLSMVTEAMKRLEEKIACAAEVQQLSVN